MSKDIKKKEKTQKQEAISKVLVNGKPFIPMEHKRMCELEGIPFRQHPDWKEFMKGFQKIRAEKLKERKAAKARGEIPAEEPITKHPSSVYYSESEEAQRKFRVKVKKAVVETIETAEMIKKIAKSKIDKETLNKVKYSRRLLESSEVAHIDLSTLKDITEVLLKTTKAQLDAANNYLTEEDKQLIKRKAKEDLTKQKSTFDFKNVGNVKEKKENLEKVERNLSTNIYSPDDLLKNLDKLIEN